MGTYFIIEVDFYVFIFEISAKTQIVIIILIENHRID